LHCDKGYDVGAVRRRIESKGAAPNIPPKPAITKAMSYSWIILGVLFLARTAMGFQFQSIASVAPFLVRGLHVNYAEIGTLIGLFMLPGAVVSLPAGLVGRHVADKVVAGTALGLMSVGGALVGLSHNYSMAFTGRLLCGIGAALLNIALTKMVADWFAERAIVLAMAILLASWPFGIGAALLIQPAMASSPGWRWVMYLAAGFCATAMLFVAALYRPPGSTRKVRAGKKPAAAGLAGSLRIAFPPVNESLAALVAGAIWGSYNIGMVIFFSFAPLLLVEHGALAIQAASWISFALWICILSVPLGGYLVNRIGHANAVIAISCFLSAWALGLLPSGIWPVTLSAIIGITIGPPAGAIMALPARALCRKNRSAGLGLFYTIHYAMSAAGPAIAGYLRDLTGGATTSVIFGAVSFLAVLPLLALFERMVQRQQT
jgi:predicted MFS family arabinose efflux permease